MMRSQFGWFCERGKWQLLMRAFGYKLKRLIIPSNLPCRIAPFPNEGWPIQVRSFLPANEIFEEIRNISIT